MFGRGIEYLFSEDALLLILSLLPTITLTLTFTITITPLSNLDLSVIKHPLEGRQLIIEEAMFSVFAKSLIEDPVASNHLIA